MAARHRRHMMGAAALVVMLVAVRCAGGDARPTATPHASAEPTALGTAAATEAVPRPNVPPLRCRTLLPQEAIDEALAVWDRASGDMSTIGLSRGEVCGERIASDEAVFVRIEPGRPDDFRPGATLLGVEGAPVDGVGDAARWFGGAAAEGGGSQGVLSVAQRSSLGGIVFRIALGRPDLDPVGQQEIAKATALVALRRFPGVALRPADPVAVRIEADAVDRSGQDYVQNLLAREAAGEWTRSEGLVSTLRFLAGELEADAVLRHRAVLDGSATGIARLAREYAESGDDAASVTEIERLLAILTVREPVRTDAEAGGPAAEASRRGAPAATSQAIGYRGLQEWRPDDGWCYSVYPNHGDPCFMATAAAPEFGDKYVFWYPVLQEGETEWEGWTHGPSTVRDAIRKTAQQLESMDGEMRKTEVWLAPYEGHSVVLLDEDQCTVHLNRGAQALRDRDPELLQQAVASAIARCYVDWNYGASEQWETPAAWYLSDVVYPDASIETVILKVPETLAGEELNTPLSKRSLGNMPFFEYLDAARGLEGAMDAVDAITSSGLGAVSGIDDLLHEYAQALTDGVIVDRGGAHAYGPPASSQSLSPGTAITADVQSFGFARIRVGVESGEYACVEYPDAGNLDIVASWRAGAPGETGNGSWTSQLPRSVSGQGVFLFSAADPGGTFSIRVTDVDDEPDCDDEEEGATPARPTPCPIFCDPSEFFHMWETIEQYILGND